MLNRSGIIGLCCTAANKEPSKPIIDAIAKHLEKTGSHKMLVFQCFEDMHMNTPTDIGGASVYKLINYDMLDAMVIVPFSMHDHAVIDQVVQECIKHDVPLISIDMEIPGAFTVQFGYEEAFGTIVEHVLDVHGCRRIKLFSGPADNPFSQQRVERCREIMRLHGLTLNEQRHNMQANSGRIRHTKQWTGSLNPANRCRKRSSAATTQWLWRSA